MMMQIKHFPIATVSIITLNAVIFAIGLLSDSQTQIIQNYGFIPNDLFYMSNANDDRNNNYSPADGVKQNPLSPSPPPMQSSEPLQSLSSHSSLLLESLTRLFASMFIHANIAHIAFNLFALIYLGGYAERAIGVSRYI